MARGKRISGLGSGRHRERGKRLIEAMGELQLVIDIYRYYATEGPGLLAEERLSPRGGGVAVIRKEPIGTLLRAQLRGMSLANRVDLITSYTSSRTTVVSGQISVRR